MVIGGKYSEDQTRRKKPTGTAQSSVAPSRCEPWRLRASAATHTHTPAPRQAPHGAPHTCARVDPSRSPASQYRKPTEGSGSRPGHHSPSEEARASHVSGNNTPQHGSGSQSLARSWSDEGPRNRSPEELGAAFQHRPAGRCKAFCRELHTRSESAQKIVQRPSRAHGGIPALPPY